MSLDGNLSDLEGLMSEAMSGDSGCDLPDNPMDLVVENIQTWPDVAEVIAKYPNGLPLFKKNELIALCQQLTKEIGSNPNLTIQVVRFPVLGGHTTREAVSVVRAAPRARSGLTREIRGAGLRQAVRKPSGPTAAAPAAAALPSTQKLGQLEKQAGALMAALQAEPPDSPRHAALVVQTKRAWQNLASGLAARLEHLKKSGGAPRAIMGYQKALQKVEGIKATIV